MNGIQFIKIKSDDELRGHNCGVASIDKMVENSFLPHLLRQQDTYKITYKNRILGFYAIRIIAIECDDADAEFAEYYDTEPVFGALYIKYIAIETQFQNHRIGTNTLNTIIKNANEDSQRLPIRLIIFDALRERIEFYQKRGFQLLKQQDIVGNSETVKMFFDLLPHSDFESIKQRYEEP